MEKRTAVGRGTTILVGVRKQYGVLIIRQEQHMKEYCGDAAKNVARHDEVCGGGGNIFTPASTTPATTAVVAQRGGAEGKTGREWVNLSMNL